MSLVRVIIVMGVSGSGKTEVGKRLAIALGSAKARFFDGDDFHTDAARAKMGSGIPLNNEDRSPWLAKLRRDVIDATPPDQIHILACSALKRDYRQVLKHEGENEIKFVYLKGDFETIHERMSARQDHYMKDNMLRSQFEVLEAPNAGEAMVVPIDQSLDEITREIIRRLELPVAAAE